jgi:hypothetical protein
MFEIESTKVAKQKGNAREKPFAREMSTDHTKTSNDVKGVVTSGNVKAELPGRSTAPIRASRTRIPRTRILSGQRS